jgi:hypothetical protein
MDFQIHKAWVDKMTNAKFVDYLYEAYKICKKAGVDPIVIYIENNSLQNPHYEQVILPEVFRKKDDEKINLPITPDTRDKPYKWSRISGTLEPMIRLETLTFNIREKDNPHMIRLKKQFKNANSNAKALDGPDMVEGGVVIINDKIVVELSSGGIESQQREPNKHRL